jgi:hypothetical protein
MQNPSSFPRNTETPKLNGFLYFWQVIIWICLALLVIPVILGVRDTPALGLALLYVFTVMPVLFISGFIFLILFFIRMHKRKQLGLKQDWRSSYGVTFMALILLIIIMVIKINVK